ncbi:tetratricopeptide repeat protein 16 isoform X2 [Podarcis raffonei]|uniref:tetratricopeptide repeat protein 16 isoform X2 n=1 Tax=Podarcis raffonei TaxID=65483 RepID=UPI0023298170|nr:tetratricopeptide repeat protein 16 isoform X2 [Podarcis raffonei]
MEWDEEEEENEKEAQEVKEVKMSTVYLEFFPTAVTEEKLEEARQRKISRIFGAAKTLQHVKNPNKVGTFEGILQNKIDEHCNKGEEYFSQREWENAITCYTKALNLDPNKVELYEKKAEALLQLCDFQSAALHLQKAYIVSSHQEDIGCRFAFVFHLQGQCLYEQSAYLDALESFTRASELQPQNKLYRMRSIACLAALKKYNDCLQMVNEEVAQERKNPDLFVLRARLYQCFGKVTFCFHNLQDALELDPEHSEALLMLERLRKEAQKFKEQAVSKAVKGNLKAALLKINRAIEHNPLQADYCLFRGNIMRRLRDFDAAIGDYLRAVELSREEDGSEVCVEAQKQVLLTYNDFAVHCYDKGFYEEAVLLLNKAITGEKNEKGLYVNRGDCFLKLGELNFAMADYQQALDLQPFDPSLQKRAAWLYDEMGLQEFRESRYPQAEAYFSQAIENNPRELRYYMHRAKTRLFLQETMGAKEDLITAFLLDPTREEIHSLANSLFPGEPIQSALDSKIGELAKALLDRRLKACPIFEASANQKSSESEGSSSPKDFYIENDELEAPEEEKRKQETAAEEKRLNEKMATCLKKSNMVNKELKAARENTSLEPTTVRLDPCPHLPEKEHSEEPYKWRKFSQGIGHF